MAYKVIMPKQGLQMTEGTITKWLKHEGDAVTADEPLFEIETDKLTITIPAPESGTLLKIIEPEGALVPITELIAVIGKKGEDISAIKKEDSAPVEDVTATGFDVAVIGGGPGGYICAIRCAQYGKRVVLVEKGDIGGTCLNRGCIPTKALLHSAEMYVKAKNSGELGVIAQDVSYDYEKMAGHKNNIVRKLQNGVESLLKGNQVSILRGEAKLAGGTDFVVAGKRYRAGKLVLATGSAPATIPVTGVDLSGVINSDDVLSMNEIPESVIIIGGGVIGVEFATLFNMLGKKVTILEMLPSILAGQEEEIVRKMSLNLKIRGVEIHTNAKLLEIRSGMLCVFEKEGKQQEIKAAKVILSVGRKADYAGLGLDAAGVAIEKGFVVVDEHMRTNVPDIFAIGDLIGNIQLAHVASSEGLVAAANACGKEQIMSYDVVPSCIYSEPEIASVGLTEKQAVEKGIQVKIGSFHVATNGRAMIMGVNDGISKIITDAHTGELLGAHLMAPRATDMIGEIAAAMRAEATIEELADTIHPHPTVSEVLMEAAHDVENLCVHKISNR